MPVRKRTGDTATLPEWVHGSTRTDGTFIGFDYARQAWIDTDPRCLRDPFALPGSTSNPLDSIESLRRPR